MLNTQKLLYILPDVAYLAELLPAKKEHSFTIQAFRQINGEFLDDNLFIAENVQKLLSKIDADSYRLVLPDFLFTNTIVEVKETQEAKVKSYIKEELLPSLEISKETHEIETFILTQYNQVSKVQLTALERSVLDPIVVGAKDNKIQITGISPLSWSIKSVVSLEPSVTVIQMGDMLYVGEHYIGVDQCTQAPIGEVENVVETIKTLKGAQPSIQTIYLLSNELVENQLKEQASSILPIQQLTSFKEDDSQMPSYVRQIIESGMKTFDIPDYPVPNFGLPKQPVGDVPAVTATPDESEAETKEAVTKSEMKRDDEIGELPGVLPPTSGLPLTPPSTPPDSPAIDVEDELKTEVMKPLEVDLNEDDEPEPEVETPKEEKPEPKINIVDTTDTSATTTSTSEPDLHQFAHENTQKVDMIETPSSAKEKPPVIKNKSGIGNMLKMIFITLAVFSATVAVGVAIGLGVLSWSNQNGNAEAPTEVTPSPVAQLEESPAPTLTPSPSATASAAVDTSDTDVLVVNATTTPGYAGSTKTKLDAADFGTVRAANARGDYEPGTYVLMEEEDQALITALEEATDLDLEYTTGYATEDPQGTYGAVIVLAE